MEPRPPRLVLRRLAAASIATLTLATLVPPTVASHGDGSYDMPLSGQWDTATLDVLVVPPNHGPLLKRHVSDTVNQLDPEELGPYTNTYLPAILESIADWKEGIAAFGPDWLVNGTVLNVYVVGQDDIPAEALADPEIVVTALEEQGAAWLGAAVMVSPLAEATGRYCVVTNAKAYIESLSYREMYGLNAHEFGHCLGLGHPRSDVGNDYHPEGDVMAYGSLKEVKCVSNLDVAGLEQAFGAVFGQPGGGVATVAVEDYEQYDCTA